MNNKLKKNRFIEIIKQLKLAFLFVTFAVVFVLINLFAGEPPVMMINANTRSVEYTLLNSESGKIAFQSPALLRTNPEDAGECITGLFEPEQTSTISYEIFSDALIIRVRHPDKSPSGFFIPKNGQQPIPLENHSSIVYGSQTNCTDEPAPLRLPIWGVAAIGKTPTAPTNAGIMDPFSGLLLDGNVMLFGQNIFGDGLYPAGEFNLPAGARLSSQSLAPWWGYATFIENSKSQDQLTVMKFSASTQSEALNLDRLASGAKTEKIETNILNQLTKDPFTASLGLILAGLFFLSEFLISLSILWKKNEN